MKTKTEKGKQIIFNKNREFKTYQIMRKIYNGLKTFTLAAMTMLFLVVGADKLEAQCILADTTADRTLAICPIPGITMDVNDYDCGIVAADIQTALFTYWISQGLDTVEISAGDCASFAISPTMAAPAGGVYTFDATAGASNIHSFNATADGGILCSDSAPSFFSVELINTAPVITECNDDALDTITVTLNSLGSGLYEFTAVDPDFPDDLGTMLTWNITGATLTGNPGEISFDCTDMCNQGTEWHTVNVEVTDRCGAVADCDIVFKVISSNFEVSHAHLAGFTPACGSPYNWLTELTITSCGVTLAAADYVITPLGSTNLAGQFFEYGTQTYNVMVTEVCSGNTSTVSWDVVLGNPTSGPLACNNSIQLSLDSDCEVELTADMILEGGDALCYEGFNITIEGVDGHIITWPGTYKVTVSDDASGNSCWGEVVVEDKLRPQLDCQDLTITCSQDITPDSTIITKEKMIGTNLGVIADGGCRTISFDFTGLPAGSTIMDVNVQVDVSHDFVSDLTGSIDGPTLPSQSLFVRPGSFAGAACNGDDMSVYFDDNAPINHGQFELFSNCGSGIPSIDGSFEADDPLSNFDGTNPVGTWTIEICDQAGNGGGTVDNIELEFFLSHGTIPFPVGGDITAVAGEPGKFTVDGNHCDATTIMYTDEEVPGIECQTDDYLKIIKRTWMVTDASGNTSTCMQNIHVLPNTFEHLVWPPDYDNIDLDALNCSQDFPLDDNNYPHPSHTGMPYDWSSQDSSFCENIQKVYTDLEIPICTNAYKLIRTWKLLNWCTGEVLEYDQIIKVEPFNQVAAGNEFKLVTIGIEGGYTCLTDYIVDPVREFDADIFGCNGDIVWTAGIVRLDEIAPLNADGTCSRPDIDVEYFSTVNDVTYNSDGTVTLKDLQLGCNWVRFIAENDCGSMTPIFLEINVVDNVPPVAVCDEFTVVGIGVGDLGEKGEAWVYAETFDDISWDNCAIDRFEARRMDSSPCTNTRFAESVKFCCSDVGESIMVEFAVYDVAGNSNTCMVTVSVQDKLPPVITCPDTAYVDCWEDITNLHLTGEPTAYDNCCDPVVTFSDSDAGQCNLDTVYRVWTATDEGGRKAQCTQVIIPVNPNLFDPSEITNFWPGDDLINGCGQNTDTSVTGSPAIPDDVCSLIAATSEDLTFQFVDDVCLKILRSWTVIDWCQYEEGYNRNVLDEDGFPIGDANNNGIQDGIWYYTQTIKVVNTNAPTFTSSCEDRVICGYGDNCTGTVDLDASASDDCTPDDLLKWKYQIDFDYNGWFVADTTIHASDDASGTYDFGTHAIKWFVEDRCGNVEICEYTFELEDCKAPTPYCLSNVTTVVMPSTGTIQIWANDFNLGSFDNCTPQEQLTYSFSSNPTDRFFEVTCGMILNGRSQMFPLEMWVTDANGKQDFCQVTLEVQDNGDNVCDDTEGGGARAIIQGGVIAENSEMMDDVEVRIESPGQAEFPIVAETNVAGDYAFNDLVMGYSYLVKSSKNDDPLNGVSTLDIVLIQQHILGLRDLNSPYKVIAADADNNEYISASDIITLRKLILGITTDFTNDQESWRFVDKNQNFANTSNPFPYTEQINITTLNNSMTNMDFVGVKIGDVNGSTKANNAGSVEIRSHKTLNFYSDVQSVEAGKRVEVPVYADNFNDIIGFQYTLGFDQTSLNFVEANAGMIELTDANIGTAEINNGMIAVSWNDVELQSYDNDEVLFTMVFEAAAKTNVENALRLNSALTRAEAYANDFEVINTSLEFRDKGAIAAVAFNLYQNAPNPFGNNTTIGFDLPKAAKAKLTVYDVNGRIIKVITGDYDKGYNEVQISKNDLGVTGVMYYTLETNEYTARQKMIGIE